MIKGILLDLDNTLYDYETCHLAAMSASKQYAKVHLGVSCSEFINSYEQAKAYVKNTLGVNCASSHNRLLYFQKMLELMSVNPIMHGLNLYNAYWDEFLAKMKLRPAAEDFIDKLRNSNIKICICTDLTVQIQYRKLMRLNLHEKINSIVTSEEVGAEKPDKRVFALCLKKLELCASDCIFIGDDYKKDILGAKNMGIYPILINSNDPSLICEKVNTFYELINILDHYKGCSYAE